MVAPRLAFSAAHLTRAQPILRQSALRRAAAFSTSRTALAKVPDALAADAANTSYIKGTVNEPTTFPPPNKAHGSIHWTFERSLSAALVPLTAATAVTSANPVLDGILGCALVVHSHMGFDQCLIDYVHDHKFPKLGPVLRWTVRAMTVGVLVGVYSFNTNDIGLTELVKKVWKAS